MGSFSIWHWLIVLVVVLILFGGRGKVSQLMGDFGKGLKSFKNSMREDEPFADQEAPRETRALPPEQPRAAGTAQDCRCRSRSDGAILKGKKARQRGEVPDVRYRLAGAFSDRRRRSRCCWT